MTIMLHWIVLVTYLYSIQNCEQEGWWTILSQKLRQKQENKCPTSSKKFFVCFQSLARVTVFIRMVRKERGQCPRTKQEVVSRVNARGTTDVQWPLLWWKQKLFLFGSINSILSGQKELFCVPKLVQVFSNIADTNEKLWTLYNWRYSY